MAGPVRVNSSTALENDFLAEVYILECRLEANDRIGKLLNNAASVRRRILQSGREAVATAATRVEALDLVHEEVPLREGPASPIDSRGSSRCTDDDVVALGGPELEE